MGFTATKPKFIPHIREANKVKRLDFCQQLIATNDQFNDVIFTDESSFQIGQHRQIVMTRIVRNEKGKIISRDVPQIPKLKHPLKVHVWGGISRKGSTQLVIFGGIMNAEFYTKEILEKTLLPFIQEFFPAPLSHRFWQDNDPKHTSKMAKKFLETNAKYAESWPNITRKGDAPADADDWKDVANKFEEHFSPNPAPRD